MSWNHHGLQDLSLFTNQEITHHIEAGTWAVKEKLLGWLVYTGDFITQVDHNFATIRIPIYQLAKCPSMVSGMFAYMNGWILW